MGDVLNVLFGIVVLFVAVWVVIFGGLGALLSRSRGGNILTGFTWGTALGPIGWGIVWLRTRGGARVDGWSGIEAEPPRGTEATEQGSGGIRF